MERKGRRAIVAAIVAVAIIAAVAVALVMSGVFGQKGPDGLGGSGDVVINDDVVVYEEGQSPFEIIASDGESVTVSSTEGLSEGAILAAGVTGATPNGLLRRLGAVEESSGGYKFATTQAALTEAIDKCDVSYTITIGEDGDYIVADDRTGEVSPLVQRAFADGPLGVLIDYDQDWARVYAEDAMHVSLKIERGDIEMRVVNEFEAGVDLDLGEQLTYEGSELELFDKYLAPVCFMAGHVPIVLTNRVTADLTAGGRVGVDDLTASASIGKAFGFEYTSAGGLRAISEDSSKAQEPTFSEGADTRLSVGVDVELAARFSSLLYNCAGPEFSVGLKSATDAELQRLVEGEDMSGAITLPGLDWKLKGMLREKVTVPLAGEFKLQVPFNVFDNDGAEISQQIFDTGDAITLLDVEKEFGEVDHASTTANDSLGSYRTKFQEVNMVTYPYFTFAVPLGWSVSSDEVSGDGETVTVDSVLGASIKYSHLPLNIGGAQLGRTMMRAELERVADSSFVPTGVQGTDHSHLGEFMVAHVTITGMLDMNTDADYRNGDFGEYYAVVPASMEGTQEYLQGTPEVFLSFDYSAKISFFCAVPDGGLAPTDQASAIEILSSFKIGD